MPINPVDLGIRLQRQPVLPGEVLINQLGLNPCLTAIAAKARLGPQCFAQWCTPAVHRVAEYAQLLPLTAHPRFAKAGGVLVWLLEGCLLALHLRLGDLLPRGVPSEELFRNEHRWTVALFLASVLQDLDQILARTKVQANIHQGADQFWDPRDGSLVELGASWYRVIGSSDVPTQPLETSAAGFGIWSHVVSAPLARWLAEDPILGKYLSSHPTSLLRDPVLTNMVLHARREITHGSAAKREHSAPIQTPGDQSIEHHAELGDPHQADPCQSEVTRSHRGTETVDPTFTASAAAPPNHPHDLLLPSRMANSTHDPHNDRHVAWEPVNPIVRKIRDLLNHLDADSAQSDFNSVTERFISLDQLTSAGIDAAYAIRCLAQLNLLIPGGLTDRGWVHCRRADDRDVQGIVVINTPLAGPTPHHPA